MRKSVTILFSFISIICFGQFSLLYNNKITSGIPTDSLEVYYKFDNNLNDYSGNGNTGVISGTETYDTNRFDELNTSLYFNGLTDLLSTNTITIDTLVGFTFNVWAKQDDLSNSRTIINLYTDADNYLFIARISNEYRLYTRIDGVLSSPIISTGVYVTTNWHMVTLVYDPSTTNKMELLLDNVSYGTSTEKFDSSLLLSPKVRLGSRATAVYRYLGSMDDARIFTRPLTGIEITKLYEEIY